MAQHNLDGCTTPDCLMCEWTVETVLRGTRRLIDAMITERVPPLRVELWTPPLPPDRHYENRRLPMLTTDV